MTIRPATTSSTVSRTKSYKFGTNSLPVRTVRSISGRSRHVKVIPPIGFKESTSGYRIICKEPFTEMSATSTEATGAENSSKPVPTNWMPMLSSTPWSERVTVTGPKEGAASPSESFLKCRYRPTKGTRSCNAGSSCSSTKRRNPELRWSQIGLVAAFSHATSSPDDSTTPSRLRCRFSSWNACCTVSPVAPVVTAPIASLCEPNFRRRVARDLEAPQRAAVTPT
mmetsp:Transcript_56808/g.102038  ORF Transcript_56808/g.102038 Transcript_56808/m.102038 type:complete len:225 (+) Transcript_56808:202-876(+)